MVLRGEFGLVLAVGGDMEQQWKTGGGRAVEPYGSMGKEWMGDSKGIVVRKVRYIRDTRLVQKVFEGMQSPMI